MRRAGSPAGAAGLSTVGRLVALLAAFVATSVIAGVLTAGLVMPTVGATGTVARSSVDFFDSLPEELEPQPLSQQSRILYADGSHMATFFDQNRIVVPLSAISPLLRQAVVAIEDSRFYEHGGVDMRGMTRAFVNNFRGGDTQGASTLTQQWIKNVLAEEARREGGQEAYEKAVAEDYGRKIREAKLAIAAERRLSKDQVLENYLNIALFGDGQYGVATASQHFFNKSAKDLTLPEAALLAGMIQIPRAYDPVEHPERALKRRNVVLKRMLELGLIDRAEHDEAAAVPIEDMLHLQDTRNGCHQAGSAAFFCDYVIRTILQDPEFGDSPKARQQLLYRGGLTITTTLEKPRQEAAQKAVSNAAAPTDGGAAALVSVQPGSGRVVAMAQSRKHDPREKPEPGGTSLNYNVDRSMGGGDGFQVGSTFKPVTLATWLDQGKSLYERVNAPGRAHIPFRQIKSSCARLNPNDTWNVGNSEGQGRGSTTVLEGTYRSINTAYANMMREMDLCQIYDTAKRLDMHRADGGEMQVYPSFILGTEEIAPLTMASAYAAFAKSGTWCEPLAISEVKNSAGDVIAQPKPDCSQAISKEVADGVAHALSNTLDRGTAACCDIRWPAAGKTGTTNDSTETWFVGFTRQLSTAVWVGTPDKRPKSLNGQTLNGKRYHRVYGATVAAPTWRAYMSSAMDGLGHESFPAVATRLIRNPYPPPEPTATSRPSRTSPGDTGGGGRGGDGDRGGGRDNGGGRGGDNGGGPGGGGEDNGGPPTQDAPPPTG
jgi:membrane peptidoglycan carboxypeptidase